MMAWILTLVIAKNLLDNKIKVVREYGDLPLIECFPGKLNQVFLNIISNAIYSVKKQFGEKAGGQITIRTGIDEKNVFIKIKDNGTGMDDKTLKKLFDPFFTNETLGEGTGAGFIYRVQYHKKT